MAIFMKKRALWTTVALIGLTSASAAWGAEKPKPAAAKTEAAAETGAAKVEETKTSTVKAPEVKATEVKTETKAVVDSRPDSEGGLLGPVTLGPSVSLALPSPINLGVEGRFLDHLGFGVNYGFLPEFTFSGAKLKLTSFDARVRVFPFGGAFFLGTSLGRQSITASNTTVTTVSGQSVTSTVSLDANTVYATPSIGWRWGGRKGFVFGIDFGYQVSLSSSSTLATTFSDPLAQAAVEADPEYAKNKADAEKVGRDVGDASLPAFTALHISYLF